MVMLVIDTGSGSELNYEFAKNVISIGASGHNDVILRAPGVAPVHLVLRRSGESLTFLGQQRQIVLLNGERRSRGVLEIGDKIRIGTATLMVRANERDGTAAADMGAGEEETEQVVADEDNRRESATKPRVEMVLYNEPERLALARRRLLDVFQPGANSDVVASLEGFFASTFPGRNALLAWLDQQGQLQPISANWTGKVPQLPARTFTELERGDRIGVLRGGARELLIHPVSAGGEVRVYLVLETEGGDFEDDRVVMAELAGMVATHWEMVSGASTLLGEWENDARARLEERLPGTSQAIGVLRDQMLSAARSTTPVLLYGRPGSGRAYLASLIASLCPTGKPWIRVVNVREGDDDALRVELFGSGNAMGVRGIAENAGGGVVVIRDVERMTAEMQRETAATIERDAALAFGSRVRWMLTTSEDCMGLVAEGRLDETLFSLVQSQLVRVPPLQERREDLPLLIVRMLQIVGAEQGKQIQGVALETLDALLSHPFEGQMTELLGELRRLVSATPGGEMVRGSVRRSDASVSSQDDTGQAPDAAVMLGEDDLKVVIPAVEKMLIDRVLRRSMGNQSKAARELNLSRGALIAKIKDYEIPDYRSLRRDRN
jgi:DNA-binding NtrC family response regulator